MFCSKCGTENRDEDLFCVKCGESLDSHAEKPSSSHVKGHKKTALIICICVAALLCVMAVLVFVFNIPSSVISNSTIININSPNKQFYWWE